MDTDATTGPPRDILASSWRTAALYGLPTVSPAARTVVHSAWTISSVSGADLTGRPGAVGVIMPNRWWHDLWRQARSDGEVLSGNLSSATMLNRN
jgi:hypothetical protein